MSVRILERTPGRSGADEADPIGREALHARLPRATARRVISQEFDAGSERGCGAQADDAQARTLDIVQAALRGAAISRPIGDVETERAVEAQAGTGCRHGKRRVVDAQKQRATLCTPPPC